MRYKSAISLVVVAAACLSACGSIKTLAPGAKQDMATNQKYRNTRCEAIPRTYSGVMYVMCTAYIQKPETDTETDTTERPGQDEAVNVDKSIPGASVLDLFLSGVIDTLVLPYTLFRQLTEGGFKFNVDPEYRNGELIRRDY
ncbi:MAG: YceK/YidQ family lipoprotein [Gammaproteobacteria bacterium]|nr:YceK/YidQ family lipoprotein [Gammaproteobacteria bacterium]